MAAAPLAIAVMGPTASGKTDLAMALAHRYPCEIISVDSAQVYRHMDIGSAKPDVAMRTAVPHHLIDIRDPTESFSAGEFRAQALSLMATISARGRIPLLVGGTMLYFRALRQGLNDLPTADPVIRARIDEHASREGWPALHAELARVDAPAAARIHPNDAQRIQRALEVFHATGTPLSSHFQLATESACQHRVVQFALMPADRTILHARIATRFDAMLQAGLVEEVRKLRQRFPLTPDMNAMRCVGYRQVWQHLETATSLAVLREQGISATRQLAKRQTTWLRATSDTQVLDPWARDLLAAACARIERAQSATT